MRLRKIWAGGTFAVLKREHKLNKIQKRGLQKAIEKWLEKDNTWYFCDTLMGLGEERLLNRENVFCQKRSSGMTRQAVVRLNQKVLENLKNYIED